MIKWLKIAVPVFISCYLIWSFYYFYRPIDYYFWHSLGRPPEKITKIASVRHDTVVVQTNSKRYFYCDINATSVCWSAKEFKPDELSIIDSCWEHIPNENSIQTESDCTYLHTLGQIQTLYQLRNDGNVYVKQRAIITIIGYMIMTFFAGIITIIVLAFINRRPREQTITIPEEYLPKK